MNIQLMKLLATLLRRDGRVNGGNREIGTKCGAALMLLAFLTILLCSVSVNGIFALSIAVLLLLRLGFLEGEIIAEVLKTTLLAAGAAAVFMLPSVFLGNPGSFGAVTGKVFVSVLALSMLREAVSWKDMTAALSSFHVPPLFILTLDMTVRFLVLLGRFSNAMLEAVSLRRVEKRSWKNAGTGGILGNTFVKSQQLAQQTQEAMACRCWSMDAQSQKPHRQESLAGRARRNAPVIAAAAAEIGWFALTQYWIL